MTDDALFQQALAFVWRPENDGQPYHVTPGDHGGATAWGVTYRACTAFETLHHMVNSTPTEFARLPRQAFEDFYRVAYWNVVQGDHLPPGIGLMLFDAAVMSGPVQAVQMLQYCVDTDCDGILGPITLAAVHSEAPAGLIDDYLQARLDFYESLRQPEFLDGWKARAARCHALAVAAARAG